MRFKLEKPNKDEFFKNLADRKTINYIGEIYWLVNSDLDVSFYREDDDRTVEISKRDMEIALEQNWEMR